MTLRAIFALPMAVILVVTLALIGQVVGHSVADARSGREATVVSEHVRRLLLAQEKLCLERGPTIGVLSTDPPVANELAAGLATERRDSDLALQAVLGAPELPPWQRAAIQELELHLAAARQMVDAVSAQPRVARRATDIEHAISGIAAAVPPLRPLLQEANTRVGMLDPFLGMLLSGGRDAADLRDAAGLAGTEFAATLALHLRLQPRQVDAIRILQGRVMELHRHLEEIVQVSGGPPFVKAALATMETKFFGIAQSVLEDMIALGVSGGDVGISVADFAASYLPALSSILDVRDALLADADGRIHAKQADQVRRLQVTLAGGGLIVVATLAALALLRRRVIMPLQGVLDNVIRLAQGDRSKRPDIRRASAEVARLAAAIDVLREAALEADAAAAGRLALLQRAATSFQELAGVLRLVQAHFATLAGAVFGILGTLDALREAAERTGIAIPAAAAALSPAVAAAAAADAALRDGEAAISDAVAGLRAHCAGPEVHCEELADAMARLDSVVRASLEPVAGVPSRCLAAAHAVDRLVGADESRRREIRSCRRDILAACEQVGSAKGALSGALFQAHSVTHRLMHLTEEVPLTRDATLPGLLPRQSEATLAARALSGSAIYRLAASSV